MPKEKAKTMAKTLDVYLHRHLSGHLIQDDHGELGFKYAESWLNDPTAIPLSHSLPLRTEPFDRHECRGFFGGILPEEGKREIIARNLGISPRNDFAMLEQIGGECAGAVTFLPAGTTMPEREDHYRRLTTKDLAETLKTLPRRPLMAGARPVARPQKHPHYRLRLYCRWAQSPSCHMSSSRGRQKPCSYRPVSRC